MAQGTLIPVAIQIASDADNKVVAGALAYFTAAGTDDLIAVYADVDLQVPLTNPVVASAAGRFPEIFMAPGIAYDLDITTPAGESLPGYPAVNALSVPVSEHPTSIVGTVGEAVPATYAVYLSDGQGSRTAGRWYLADATNGYSSSLPEIGVATADIASGASGTIQVGGRIAGLTGLTPGASYYLSTTPGWFTTATTAAPRYVGQADSPTSIVLSPNPPLKTGGFTPYPFVWTSNGSPQPSLGNGVVAVNEYLQVGKLVFLRIAVTFGSTTTYGTAGWNFALPSGAPGIQGNAGNAIITDTSAVKWFTGMAVANNTTAFALFDNSSVTLSQGQPIIFAAGDAVHIQLWYTTP